MLRKSVGARAFAAGFLTTTFLTAIALGASPSPVAAQTAAMNFSIQPQSLDGAMAAFSRATRIQVLTRGATTQRVRSPGVTGSFTPQQALSAILSGTGLVAQFASGNTVTLVDPRQAAAAVGVAPGEAIELETITVSGDSGARREAARRDAPYQKPGSSAYISAEQVERFGGSTAGDIFKSTPGVIASGNHSGGASVDVNIRGMQGQNRVKVAIDGTQQSTTTWRGYLGVDERVYVDPDFIGGVTIDKGPTDGAAGAGAIGGVVGIRTLLPEDIVQDGKEWGVRLRTGTNDNAISPPSPLTMDQRNDAPGFLDFENGFANATLATKQENFELIAAVAKRKSGNYFAGEHGPERYSFNGGNYPLSFTKPGEEAFNTSEDSTSALLKAKVYWGDGHSLQAGYTHFESKFGEAMGSLLFSNEQTWRQINLSTVDVDTWTSTYRWDPDSELVDFKANVWATHVDMVTRLASLAVYFPQFGIIPADDPRPAETWTYGGDVSNRSFVATDFGDLTFNYGASYLIEDMDGDRYCSRPHTRDLCVWLEPSKGAREIGSAFSTFEWQANDWLKINGGLRYDTFRLEDKNLEPLLDGRERDGGRLNPSLAVTVEPYDGVQLFAQYAEGFRPPTLRETIFSDSNATPNPDLDPEVAKNWEFGANYLKEGLLTEKDKVRFKTAYFINNYEGYISRVNAPPVPGQPFFTFANLDSAMFQGIEVSGSYDAGFFFGDFAVTHYTDFEFCREAGSCISNSQENDYAANHMPPELSVSMTLGMRFFDEKLAVGVRGIKNGERLAPLTVSDRQRTQYWLPYTVFDAFATYDINDNVRLEVQGENLTDRYYVDAMDGWMAAPGRTIRASMTAKF